MTSTQDNIQIIKQDIISKFKTGGKLSVADKENAIDIYYSEKKGCYIEEVFNSMDVGFSGVQPESTNIFQSDDDFLNYLFNSRKDGRKSELENYQDIFSGIQGGTVQERTAFGKDSFIKKYGEIIPIVHEHGDFDECRVRGENYYKPDKNATQPLFQGKCWTTGFHKDDSDPQNISDWAALDSALEVANKVKLALKDNYNRSSADNEYYIFVLPEKINPDNFAAEFSQALGCQLPPEDFIIDTSDESPIFYDMDAIGDEEDLLSYYSEEEVENYRNAAKILRDNLNHVRAIELTRKHLVSPLFRIGMTAEGFWAGVYSICVTT